MKEPDNDNPANPRADQDHRGDDCGAAGAACHAPAPAPIIDLDSPLIGSAQGQITKCACTDFEEPDADDDDAFEDWACWPCPDENLWAAYGHPVGDLRNPPRFILDELGRTN